MLQKALDFVKRFEANKVKLAEMTKKSQELKDQYEKILSSRDFIIKFSMYLKDQIKSKTEELANSALRCIFNDKEMFFRIIPNQTKRGLQYDMYIETDGTLTPLQDCKGGGVMDIISIALLVSFLIINSHKTDRVILLDEPFKNLDNHRLNNAIIWLKGVTEEFKIQFILVSHEDGIIENADKIFQCSHNGKESIVV